MEIVISLLAVLAIIMAAISIHLIVTERNELARIAAELTDQFKDLSIADIRPQPDWPKWARYNYDTFYKNYRNTFDWCAYRMKYRIISRYTVKVLEDKFYWLHSEQEGLRRLLQNIEKYRKVPEMKIQLQERYESFQDKVKQGEESFFLRSHYETIKVRFGWIKTDNQDDYPDVYRRLEHIKDDLDYLERELSEKGKLKVA